MLLLSSSLLLSLVLSAFELHVDWYDYDLPVQGEEVVKGIHGVVSSNAMTVSVCSISPLLYPIFITPYAHSLTNYSPTHLLTDTHSLTDAVKSVMSSFNSFNLFC